MSAPKFWLWPNRTIRKAHAAELRTEHNDLVREHAELVSTVEDLLPWARTYAETQRTPLHGSVEFVRVAKARALLAKIHA